MSDIFDTSVEVPESFESSCLGACMLGLYRFEKIASLEVVEDLAHTQGIRLVVLQDLSGNPVPACGEVTT